MESVRSRSCDKCEKLLVGPRRNSELRQNVGREMEWRVNRGSFDNSKDSADANAFMTAVDHLQHVGTQILLAGKKTTVVRYVELIRIYLQDFFISSYTNPH